MKFLLTLILVTSIYSKQEKIYEQEKLQNVLIDIAVHYGVEVIVEQDLIKQITITGKVDLEQKIKTNLKKILIGLPLDFKINKNNINISKKAKTEYTVFGIISDLKNGEMVYLASVFLKNNNKGTSSNEKGFFSVGKIQEKKISLIIQHVNYFSDTISILFNDTAVQKRLNIKLMPKTYKEEMREVLSNESKLPTRVNEKSTTIKTGYANSIANFVEPDLFRDLQRLPGIASLNALTTNFSIRSSAPGENIIMIDGIELYAPFHFNGIFSSFNLQGLREYEIFKDNIPTKYNDKLAGSLNIISKEGNHKEFEGNGQISILSAAMSLEGPIANGAYFISMRRSYWDLIPSDLYMYMYDLNTNIYQDITENDRLSIKFYNSANNFDRREEESVLFDEKLDYSNQLIKFDWRRILSSKLFGSLSISKSQLRINRRSNFFSVFDFNNNSFPKDDLETKNNIEDLSINADFDYHYKNVLINLGYRYKMLESKFPFIANNNFILTNYKTSASFHKLYGESEYEFDSHLKLAYGASLNYSSINERFTFQPKIYLSYQSPAKGLNFFSGVRHNYQETVSSNSSDSYNRFVLDNSIKNIPRITQFTFGSFYQVSHSSAKVSLFKKWSRNLLSLNNDIDSTFIGVTRLSDFFLSYNTDIIGAEFYYHYKVRHFESQLSYTLTKANELSANEEKLFYLDRRHHLSHMMNFQLNETLFLNNHLLLASPFQDNEQLIGLFTINTRLSFKFTNSEFYLQYHRIKDTTSGIDTWLPSIGYKFKF